MAASLFQPGSQRGCAAAGRVHDPLAVALARDGQRPALGIVIRQLSGHGFVAAQARAEHQRERRGVAAARRAGVVGARAKQRAQFASAQRPAGRQTGAGHRGEIHGAKIGIGVKLAQPPCVAQHAAHCGEHRVDAGRCVGIRKARAQRRHMPVAQPVPRHASQVCVLVARQDLRHLVQGVAHRPPAGRRGERCEIGRRAHRARFRRFRPGDCAQVGHIWNAAHRRDYRLPKLPFE